MNGPKARYCLKEPLDHIRAGIERSVEEGLAVLDVGKQKAKSVETPRFMIKYRKQKSGFHADWQVYNDRQRRKA